MDIISVKILRINNFRVICLVLLEPLKSAEPPIIQEDKDEIISIAAIEHCRVAKLGFRLKYLVFSFSIKISNLSNSEFK